MIEDKSIGLVVAETEEEKNWLEIKENTERDIKNLNKMLWFQNNILDMCDENLKRVKQESIEDGSD